MGESLMNDQSEELREQRLREGDHGMLNVERDLSDLDHSLLAYLADDIEIAHRANPNSWAFYRVKTGGVILVVESVIVTKVNKDRGGILVRGELDSPTFQSVDHARVVQRYKNYPGFWIDADSTDRLGAIMEEFRTPHHEGIADLASAVKIRTQSAHNHQPALLDALSSAVGQILPQPAYAEELRELRLREGDNGGHPTIKRDVSDLDQSLLAHLADDIETAHRVNPSSWALYRVASRGVVLIVQGIAVTDVNKDRGGY